MSLGPTALTSAQVAIAQKPAFGGEMKVYLTPSRHYEVGTLEIMALNSGVMTSNATEAAALAADPRDLVCVVDKADLNCGATTLTVNLSVVYADDSAGTATATLTVPAYSSVTDKVFPVGWAVDVVPDASKLIKSFVIAGVTCAAEAVGGKLTFFALPALTAFRLVGCTTDKGWTTKSQAPVSIPCGMDSSAFTKPGMSPVSNLNIKARWTTLADGLARFDGVKCTARLDVVKEGKVTSDRLFFMGYIPKTDPAAGDGADVATWDAKGDYEDLAILVAQQA